ncbi:MAG: hypothetical protein CTY36_00020 [Methylocystis sp.]|nr:MAG: hypothetical protein CTY36_00020 [Methylocystis sp.]
MLTRNLFSFVFRLFVLLTLCEDAIALDPISSHIQKVSSKYCDIILSGYIKEGDFKNIVKILKPFDAETRNAKLCLNDSDGGNYAEALKIIDYIKAGRGSTVLLENYECFSACALLFLFGSERGDEDIILKNRRMHASAKLGFHAPFLVDYSSAKGRAQANVYREGILAIQKLLRADTEYFLPSSLLVEMLKQPPNELLLVDTVGKAIEWNIKLFGYRQPSKVTVDMLEWACINELRSQNMPGNNTIDNHQEPAKNATPIEIKAKGLRKVFGGFGGEGMLECYTDVYLDKEGKLFLNVSFDYEKRSIPKSDALEKSVKSGDPDIVTTPTYYLYPPSTKLVAIVKREK